MGFFIIRDIIGKKSLGKIIMKLKMMKKKQALSRGSYEI